MLKTIRYKLIYIALCFLLVIWVMPGYAYAATDPITAEFSFSSEEAAIGQPFQIGYALSGGSGVFNDVTIQVLFPLGSGTAYGGFSESINKKQGSCTIVPEEGQTLSIQIYGYDSSGKQFYIDANKEIPLHPNPDLPVSIVFETDTINTGNTINGSYSIGNCESFTGSLSWTIVEKKKYDSYSENLELKELNQTADSFSFAPAFGDYAYVVLSGHDEQGRPVYVESEAVRINASGTVEPITAEFTYSSEQAVIGQPFQIGYALSDGSGAFNDVTMQVLFPLGSGTAYGGFSESVNKKQGTCTIIPEEGKTLSIQIYGYDSNGRAFYIDAGNEIPISPNPDLPVSVAFETDLLFSGETIGGSYSIGNCESFTGSLSWTIVEKKTYDSYSENLELKKLNQTADTFSFAPAFGDYAYLVLSGEDGQNRPVYFESNPIMIINDLTRDKCLFLPGDLCRIEDQAFAEIDAEGVIVPAGVDYISEDAFANSAVTKLYGRTEYVKEYADKHGLTFVRLDCY